MSDQGSQIIKDVLAKMTDKLDEDQLTLLEANMIVAMHGVRIEKESTELVPLQRDWEWYLKRFRATKRLKNCSEKTLKKYEFSLEKLRTYVPKLPPDYTDADIKYFLAMYGERELAYDSDKKISKTYINNVRLDLSSFFGWMQTEGYMSRNPVANVPAIKIPKVIKQAYTGSEMEALKFKADNPRDRALLTFLDSSGCRIGEALSINKSDINWERKSVKIYGSKGKAEREVYFTEEAAFHLKAYLDSRNDDNEALFVSRRKPYERLTIAGAEVALKKLGRSIGIHAHPHKSRRTLITRLDRRGMPLQQIQTIAGHTKPETTQIYIDMQRSAVRASYEKCN